MRHGMGAATVVVGMFGSACAQGPECASMYDCGAGHLCTEDGACVVDERPAQPAGVLFFAGGAGFLEDADGTLAEVHVGTPAIAGVVGPVADVREATGVVAARTLDRLLVQVDFANDVGTGFVYAVLPPVEELRARAGGSFDGAQDPDAYVGQACSDTFDAQHYDALIDAMVVEVSRTGDDGSVVVDLSIGARADDTASSVTDVRASFTLPAAVE